MTLYRFYSPRTAYLSAVAQTHPFGFKHGLGADSQCKAHNETYTNVIINHIALQASLFYIYFKLIGTKRMSSVYTNFSPFSSMTARAAVASVIFFSIMVTSATGTAVWKVTSAPYSVFSILISFVDKRYCTLPESL